MKNEILLNYKNEIKRKKIHLLSFLIPLHYLLFPNSILLFIALLVISILIIDIYRLYFNQKINIPIIKHINNTIRPYEKSTPMSATLLVITSLVIILIFKREIAIIAISMVAICDTAAAIYGMKFGKIKLFFNKTLEGSFAFLLTGCFLVFLLNYFINMGLDIIFLIICTLIATITESITPTKYDNITVPLSTALALYIFYLI